MTKDERIEYDEISNFVETSQPDTVAEYIRKLLKENERIAELERKVEELKANQTPTRKMLLPKNWDKYNLADKLRYRNIQVNEARKRLSDMNEMETMLTFQLQHLRHEICEKIRNALVGTEPNCSRENFDAKLYDFSGKEIFDILDEIEREEMSR